MVGDFPPWGKTLQVGALCNSVSITRIEDGEFVGQATDVTLHNALFLFNLLDPGLVGQPLDCATPLPVSTDFHVDLHARL